MAQATSYQSPDIIGQDNSTLQSSEQSPTTEKKSVLGKLKDKTSKLKNKLKPGHGGAGGAGDEDTSSSSSDEEEAPENNAFTGMTQPEYERKLDSGEAKEARDADGIIGNRDITKPVSIEEFNRRGPNDFPPSHGDATDSALASQFEGLSTEEKPSSQMDVADSTLPTDEGLEQTPRDSILDSAGNPHADDTEVAKDKPDPEGLLSGKPPATEPAKTWSQWVGEKVGLAKPGSPTSTTTANTSETGAADKPITEKLQETVIGAKDAVVGKVSEATGSAEAATQENKQAAATTDPQKQTYTQKLTGAIYGAKDSLVSSTHPGDEDKALSQKVTETVNNLPTTIKSTLGFGGSKSGSSSPATTPRSLNSPTEEAEGAPPQSPGIVSRITGSVTSLFGKKPQAESATSTTSAVPTSGTGTTETVTPTTTESDTPTPTPTFLYCILCQNCRQLGNACGGRSGKILLSLVCIAGEIFHLASRIRDLYPPIIMIYGSCWSGPARSCSRWL